MNKETIKSTDKKKKRAVLKIILLVCTVILTGWILYGNMAIQTTVYEIPIDAQYAGMDGFTIVQISDLHNAEFGKEQERLLRIVAEQEPDLIAVTGDLVDSSHTDIDVAMDFMVQAVEIAPVYYVTGNHEGWIGTAYDTLEIQLEQAGVTVLSDTMYRLQYGKTNYCLAGVMDPDMPGNNIVMAKDAVGVLLEDANDYTILLSHRPEMFETYVAADADLVLTGHYHGGQFRIPFIGGVYAPGAGFFPEQAEGTFTEGGTTMVVSRGLGNSVIPVRINNRPEVVVIRLQAGDE